MLLKEQFVLLTMEEVDRVGLPSIRKLISESVNQPSWNHLIRQIEGH